MSANDTIAAISTPIGMGGIGVIRLSGPEAIRVASELVAVAPSGLADSPSHSISYAKLVDPENGSLIDECLVSVMRAPRSYTREDIVEINIHSGVPTLNMVLQLIIDHGARLAEPGEFTKRAFLSGRLDLTQAEAIGSLIRARSEAAARAAARQTQGHVSQKITAIREGLLEMAAQLEAAVDFSDEEIGPMSPAGAMGAVNSAEAELRSLVKLADRGKIYDCGLRTAIMGRPNVGKSSLLNAISLEDRAIVSRLPGTTRDIIESTVLLGDIPLLLMDTAGWRRPQDDIEAQGISRSRAALESADLVLLVFDGSEALQKEDVDLFEALDYNKAIVTVINKQDMPSVLDIEKLPHELLKHPIVYVSAANGAGLEELGGQVRAVAGLSPELGENEMILANARQYACLKAACAALVEARSAGDAGFGEEIIVLPLKEAINNLSSVVGEDVNEEILDKIFSRFCVGK
jgi:tRNA modification GTPase